MSLYREDDEFQAAMMLAGEALGINPALVEKDYWVSEVLRVLTRDFQGDFIFKGGTSLSKCYGMIERFSEDVDLLILRGPRGLGATDRLMKNIAAATGKALGSEPARINGTTGLHRTVRLDYPTTQVTQVYAGLSPGVVLEMGIRGGDHPWETMPANCLLADGLRLTGEDISEFEDLQLANVPVLHAGRTLLEKLALLHTKLGSDPAEVDCLNYGRHYLDVYQLLAYSRVLAMLEERDEVGQVITSIQRITSEYFHPRRDTSANGDGFPEPLDAEIRPDDGWASSPAFDAANSRLAAGYVASMQRLYVGSGEPPQFAEICGRVQTLAHLL